MLLTKFSSFSAYKFPNASMSKANWTNLMKVTCGWGQVWNPPVVPGCVDTRGCPRPLPSTMEVYSSFATDPLKILDVGMKYWYSCRVGKFILPNATLVSVIELTCINDPNGGTPIWDPPYDAVVNPLPFCYVARK